MRQRLLAGLALTAAFVAGFVLIRTAPVELSAAVPAAAPRPIVAAVDELPAAPDPAPTRTPKRTTMQTETIIDDVAFDAPKMRSLADATAEDYRRRARFPRSSQPITDDVDPIERDREVTHGRSMGPGQSDPTLVTYPARVTFEAPSPVTIYAYLVQNDAKVDARAIRGMVRNAEGVQLAALEFGDDGKDGDAEANDFVYTARLTPASRQQARELKGAQLVDVRAETLAGEERAAGTGFLYSVPLAHLTGRYRDSIAGGSLVVEAEVAVDQLGRFHLEATLGSSDGKPIGWAQNAMTLEAGTAWIPLTYFGLIFRESNLDGPYVLRSVALSTTGEMPNQKNELVTNAYTTRPYQASAFSDQPYNDPNLIDTAERLEAEAPPSLEAGTQ